ncbi:leucine-rich repeat flightless-interacting protein 2 [Gambusia affinis]|uniref:leucine-rich repeat flightless-interacting protein 2 n=1 Tax=Gambusia affinis TaxID=33528 RepID=UPI001CDC3BFB|nr:leucine-rich repeat flightless-interacting protein 2 [Gambusia affinis]
MGTQGPGRKRIPNRDKLAAEEDALSQIAREAEARLAAKRAARAEAREIRMKELERQQKELFHSTKKYYGLDNKWGHIEQWMEDSERYSRLSRRHTSISDDEERMSVGSRGSYRPSDYGGLLASSSRASSRASSARASPVVEERTDREFTDKGSRTASTLSAATLASLGGASSRRGSCDTSFSVETEASIREMKDSLAEAEEKYRRAMVSNAQLHNDKTALMFQVENLMEELSDVEELLWEARRRWDDATKELERERQAHSVLKVQFNQTEETLRQTNELLTEVSDLRQKSSSYRQEISDLQEALQWKEKKIAALERHREISDIVRIERDRLTDEVVQLQDSLKTHGVVISPDTAANGDADQTEKESPSLMAEDSPHSRRESMLELRMKKLFDDREGLRDQVRLLQSQLDQRNGVDGAQNPEQKPQENGIDPHLLDLQRDANRQISELKFKLVKSEQEVTTLEQNVLRLEGQVCRYKSASENAEKIEDELKVEKRRLQRELRSALDRIEELEVSNSHLSKRLEKLKANRNALLAQQ